MDKIELLLKQSPREKVFYILKCIHECCLANQRTMDIYTADYVRSLVPESLSGFDDIVEMLEYFDWIDLYICCIYPHSLIFINQPVSSNFYSSSSIDII